MFIIENVQIFPNISLLIQKKYFFFFFFECELLKVKPPLPMKSRKSLALDRSNNLILVPHKKALFVTSTIHTVGHSMAAIMADHVFTTFKR